MIFTPSILYSRADSLIFSAQAICGELANDLFSQRACREIIEREDLMGVSTLEFMDLTLDKLFSIEEEWSHPIGWSSALDGYFPRIGDLFIEQNRLSLQNNLLNLPSALIWQKLVNSIVSHMEGSANTVLCQQIIAKSPHMEAFRQMLSERLTASKPSSCEDALADLYLYAPMAYRLALGRKAAHLREQAIANLFPNQHSHWKSAIRIAMAERLEGFSDLDQWLMIFSNNITDLLGRENIPVFAVFSRTKAISSIVDKVLKFRRFGANPKSKLSNRNQILSFLNKLKRILLAEKGDALTDDELASVLGDFLAINIVVDVDTGIDIEAQVYRAIIEKAFGDFINVSAITNASRRPYHRRLLIEGRIARTPHGRLPIEIQIQSVLDYLFGWAHYWKYKGIRIFDSLYPESNKDLSALKRLFCSLRSEQDIQDFILQQIKGSLNEKRNV
jgi:hypothetical protein